MLLSGLDVVTVPYVQDRPEAPHPAHEDGQITLKGIVRGVTPGATYEVQWDSDVDGNFDEEFLQTYTATGETLYDIGRTFVVPHVDGDTTMDVGVRVVDSLTAEESFGTFRLHVSDFRPSNDPVNWSDEELRVIQAMTVQETLWFVHRNITRTGTGAAIRGGYAYPVANSQVLQLLVNNGHAPAYSPGTISDFGRVLPSGWEASNDSRWSDDPYAETATRILNELAADAELENISSGNEGNRVGFDAAGNAILAVRLPGTTDGQGLSYHPDLGTHGGLFEAGQTGSHGDTLAAFSAALPHISGTPVQVSVAAGESWEWFVQQGVDWLGNAQVDGGDSMGSWSNGGPVDGSLDGASKGDAFVYATHGLAEAEEGGRDFGVVVDNLHKYRASEALVRHQKSDGLPGSYLFTSRGNLGLAGGFIGAARWLGVHHFSTSDNSLAFPSESNLTAGQLRQTYDRYVQATAHFWTSVARTGDVGSPDSLWASGDYLQANRNALYNAGSAGEPLHMLHFAQGFQRAEPDLSTIGNHDWNREFATYLTRAQERRAFIADPLQVYDDFGSTESTYTYASGWTKASGPPFWATVVSGLATTPEGSVVLPNYFGIDASETGIAGVSTGFAANPYDIDLENALYWWDFDAADGLGWEFGAPDATGESMQHAFSAPGTFTVTLRIVDLSTDEEHRFTHDVSVSANSAPVADLVDSAGEEDAQLLVTLAGSDPDGNPLTATITLLPAAGTLFQTDDGVTRGDQITASGTPVTDSQMRVIFVPDENEYGNPYANFEFTVNDGVEDSANAIVAVTVTEVNDAPVANADTATVAEDGSVTIDVLSNDATGPANESGQTLTVTAASALHGTVAINGNGTLTYTPNADYNGPDTISYTITDDGTTDGAADPLSASSTVSVTVTEVNDAPLPNPDTASVAEDGSVTIDVLGNDAAGPANEAGQTLTVTAASALHGTVTIEADGTLTYAPNADYNGPDTISYTITDDGTTNGVADHLSASSTVAVTVTEVNDAPVANADAASVAEDGSVTIDVLGNDSTGPANESDETLTVTAAGALHGTVIVEADGTLTYTPDADFNGQDTISYTIEDDGTTNGVADPRTAGGTVAVTVTEVNDAPVANADTASVAEDGSVTIDVLGNDSTGPANESGQALTVTAASASHGSVAINGDGRLTYTPNADYNGADTIAYTVTDNGTTNGVADHLSAGSTVAVTVTQVNDAPVAKPDTTTVAEDGSANIEVLINDAAGPGNEAGQTLSVIAASASHGSVSIAPDGTLTYTPDADYNGADTISYTITDDGTTDRAADPLSASSTVAVTVTEVNDAPVANADTASVAEDGSVTIDVLTNDAAGPPNESGQALTVTAASALHGSVAINGDGTLTYAPHADYNGPDTISYTIEDDGTSNGVADHLSAGSTVAVTVTEVNDAPVANADAASVAEDASVTIDVLTNDAAGPANESGQALTVTAASASRGSVAINGDGTLTYLPNADYNGADTISYTITDDGTTGGVADPLTASSTVAVTVTEVNDAPVANADTASVAEDGSINIDVLGNDSAGPANESGQTLTVTAASALHGSVAINGNGTLTYTPDADFNGADTIAYTVTDDGTTNGVADPLTANGTVAVTVLNVVDLSGRVFDDLDNDGDFEAGDSGLAGLEIDLVDQSTGSPVATATTDATGVYEFDLAELGLGAATYTIRQQAQPVLDGVELLDGKESTGDLGGAAADNGTVANGADSNAITGIVIGEPGTQQDTAGYDFAEIQPSSLQGLVWEDFDDDGGVDFGEIAIEGVQITLNGTDDRGNAVSLGQTTDGQGIFEFVGLRPGTYTTTEAQPSGFIDGKDVVGEVTVNGSLGDGGLSTANDTFTVVLVPGSLGINYNFGERVDGGQLTSGQTATIGFWQNRNGQRLIESLNGSEDSTLLAEYLSETFPNMYGMLGDVDRDNDQVADGLMTNEEVAGFYQTLFKRNGRTAPGGPPKVDAQVMATALATYITKESFVGVQFGSGTEAVDATLVDGVESFGFVVTIGGVGSTFVNVGDNGSAFGVDDDSDVQIVDLLLAVDSASNDGLLYDADGDDDVDEFEELDRIMANDVFSLINELG